MLVFYAVNALLYKNNILDATTHAGVQRMLGLHFVESGELSREMGRFYSDLFNQQIKVDYDDFVILDIDKVEDMLTTGKAFIRQIKMLIDKP